MAVDEGIFTSYLQGKIPPILRFYGWSSATVPLLDMRLRLTEKLMGSAQLRQKAFLQHSDTGSKGICNRGVEL